MSLAASIYLNLKRLKKKHIQNKMQNKTPLDLPSVARKDRYMSCFYCFGSCSCCSGVITCCSLRASAYFQVPWFPEHVLAILEHHKSSIMLILGSQNKQNLGRRKV